MLLLSNKWSPFTKATHCFLRIDLINRYYVLMSVQKSSKGRMEVRKDLSREKIVRASEWGTERESEILRVIDTCYIHNQLMAGFFFQVFNFNSTHTHKETTTTTKIIMQIYTNRCCCCSCEIWWAAVKVKSQYKWFIHNY